MKQAQQSLFPGLSPSRPAPALRRRVPRPAPLVRRQPLWFALHFPQLALDALLQKPFADSPHAVVTPERGVARIHAVNNVAAAQGVQAGMTLAAAWSMLPQLDVHERDEGRERELLLRLAARLQAFTPSVCLDENAVLLEVRASLNLFNGLDALSRRVTGGVQRLGIAHTLAVAPTPRAALWLARAGKGARVETVDELPAVLGQLPLAASGFDPQLLERFQGIGARRLGDVLRLPRDGLARRYSARLLRELDQALGRVADPRPALPIRRKFSSRIQLLHEIADTQRLLHPVMHLLDELEAWLQATQQGVARLGLHLVHRDRSRTDVVIGYAEATRDGARLRALVEQKLENLVLPSPVLDIVVAALETASLAGRDRTLFVEERSDDEWPQLLERLRVRLGEDAVRSFCEQQDHRPERAWRAVSPGAAAPSPGIRGRPHWLLEVPQRLRIQDGLPVCAGRIELLDGPERIETGWWDGADVARDYYIARDGQGRRVWICREVKTGRWWLQGIYA